MRVSDSHMTPGKWLKAVVLVVIPFGAMLAVGLILLHALSIVYKPHVVIDLSPEIAGPLVERVRAVQFYPTPM